MILRPAPRRRPGQVALISLFAVFTLLLLLVGVLNVTRVTATKMEQQNAADATAHAAGIELARGMNAVTVLNHLITELNALGALAMSFGGIPLEDRKPILLPNRAALRLPELAVWHGGRRPRALRAAVTFVSKSGGAIGDSRKRLLKLLEWSYRVHISGGVMATAPGLSGTRSIGRALVAAAVAMEESIESTGRALVAAAVAMEESIEFEWRVLDALERLAESRLIPLKQLCNHGMPTDPEAEWGIIPRLYKQCVRVVERTPWRAEEAAGRVAAEYGATGSLFPNTRGGKFPLELPVEAEVIHRHSENHLNSQMVRGMTPWVQYWRKPILDYGRRVLPLAEFAEHYHTHSNDFTLNMAWWQWLENETRLFRLKDLQVAGPDKGREVWTTEAGSDVANERFGYLGFALKPPPEVIGMPIFRQPQPDGMAAHAQVMIYNANPQDRPRTSKWQPVVGFDTLAWDNDVPEFEFGKEFGSDKKLDKKRNQPLIKSNWQAKLVPVALERLTSAVGTQGPELNRILDRLVTDRPLVNTH